MSERKFIINDDAFVGVDLASGPDYTAYTNELGKYVIKYANNHGLSLAQTYEKEMVQAYKEYYST